MNHKDVVALVTGGASGLGEASILELVKKGARAAIIDVDAEKGEKLAANIGASAIFVKTDVTSETDVRQAIQKIIDAFEKINVVINCSGIVNPGKLIGRKGPLSLEAFNKVLQINLVGTLNVIRLAVEQMIKNEPGEEGEKGVIINSASIAAFEGQIGQVQLIKPAGLILLSMKSRRYIRPLIAWYIQFRSITLYDKKARI